MVEDSKIPKSPNAFRIVPHKALHDPEMRLSIIENNRKQYAYVMVVVGAILLFVGLLY